MSETTLGPALKFMRQPQDVEVHRGGDWVPGSMIGWRQEEGPSCRVMVRVSEQGVETTAWADLQDVRLPEHRESPATESLPFVPRLPGRPTGRHRAPAHVGSAATAVSSAVRPVPASPWSFSDWPTSGPGEVEPTRLLPVPRPNVR